MNTCPDCGKDIRANAKRCTACHVKHWTNIKHSRRVESRAPVICKNERCKVAFVQSRSTQLYCCEPCKNRHHAAQHYAKLDDAGRARHAQESRRYRATIKEANDADRARRIAETVARINAKARASA